MHNFFKIVKINLVQVSGSCNRDMCPFSRCVFISVIENSYTFINTATLYTMACPTIVEHKTVFDYVFSHIKLFLQFINTLTTLSAASSQSLIILSDRPIMVYSKLICNACSPIFVYFRQIKTSPTS